MSISGTGSIKCRPKLMESCTTAFPAGRSRVKSYIKSMSPTVLASASKVQRLFLVVPGRKGLTSLPFRAYQLDKATCGPWTKGVLLLPCSPSHAIQRAGQANRFPCCACTKCRLVKLGCAWEFGQLRVQGRSGSLRSSFRFEALAPGLAQCN